MKYIERLKQLGYANYRELFAAGIGRIFKIGTDPFGYEIKVIETLDGTQWQYNLVDEIYDMKLPDEPRVSKADFN